MSYSLVTLLRDPNAFFSDPEYQHEDLKIPLLIVLAGGLISAVNAYIISGLTGRLLSDMAPGMESIMGILAAATAILGVLFFWIVVSVIFFLISALQEGKGSFSRCLAVVGYGHLPQVFGALIITAFSLVYVPTVEVHMLSKSAIQTPEAFQAAMAAFLQDPAMMMLSQVITIISIIFLLWSANIWIFGIKDARAISLRNAALCVGIPVILYVLYQVYCMTIVPGNIESSPVTSALSLMGG
jgi:hypothetical protein